MDPKSSPRRDFRILQAIYFLGSPTRNEIAVRTNRSPVSVTETLNGLILRGLAVKSGKIRNRTGRPSGTYRLGPAAGYTLGVSIETAGFRIVALGAQHDLIREREHALSLSADPAAHVRDIVEQISAQMRDFMAAPVLRDRRPLGIGVAPPGMVDTERGVWLHGLQVSGITHVALGDELRGLFDTTVVVEDTARCLACVEVARRPAEASRDLIYLYLGSGVGAGVLIGGEPYLGSHGMAGEVGHLVVEEEGVRCSCGNLGCLETVVSPLGILNRFQRRLSEGVISSLQKFRADGSLSLEAIRDAATSGDRLAQSTLFEVGTFLGDAVSKIIQLFNPRTLIIGGPVGVLGEHLREPLWIKVRQKVLPAMLVDLEVEISSSRAGDEALGAALLAERRFWKDGDEAGSFSAIATSPTLQ
jgi:N-acetylglucosamine repressor